MDEKLMMMEQDRLAKEKKKKKNRKKAVIAGAVVAIAGIVGIGYLGWGRHLNVQEETSVQIDVAPGQEVIYADLISVKGNEITYYVAKLQADPEGEIPQRGGWAGGAGMPDQDGESGQDEAGGQGFPFGQGEMPDWASMDGEMPDWSSMGGGMFGNSASASWGETFTYNGAVYEVTDEMVTTVVPVGTDVVTKLGTVTTFSRLAAGDKVALVVENQSGEQIITAVYIIE